MCSTQAKQAFEVVTGNVEGGEYAIVRRTSDKADICTAERSAGATRWRNIEFVRPEHMKNNRTRQAAMKALQATES